MDELSSALAPVVGSSLLTTVVVAVVVFVGGTWLKSWLERRGQHGFDQQLERLKADLSRSQEEWRVAAQANTDRISALRDGALSRLSARHAAIDERRLAAVEAIWQSVVGMEKVRALGRMAAVLNWDNVLAQSAADGDQARKLQQFGDVLWKGVGLPDGELPRDDIDKHRPFVSPLTWALFSAYRILLAHPLALVAVLRAGVGKEALLPAKDVLAPVAAALPEYAKLVNDEPTGAFTFLVAELERKILTQLQVDLEQAGSEADLSRAAGILKQVESYSEKVAEQRAKSAAAAAGSQDNLM